MTLTYRWLGVAGLEFNIDGYTLLIDPFFTRPGKIAVVSGARVQADDGLAARYAPRADGVLITHPHYDHLLDVPNVLRRSGAPVWGSPNTRTLLTCQGIPEERITCIKVGDRFDLGPFQVEVFPAQHTRIPFSRWLNGPLPPGFQPARLPLRLSDYRMDACYSFRLTVNGLSLQVGSHPNPCDLLFISPYHPIHEMENLLRAAHPRQLIPIHWDDFMRPLSKPIQPMLMTPAQGLNPWFPPIRRLDLKAFERDVKRILPDAVVSVPEIFKTNSF